MEQIILNNSNEVVNYSNLTGGQPSTLLEPTLYSYGSERLFCEGGGLMNGRRTRRGRGGDDFGERGRGPVGFSGC